MPHRRKALTALLMLILLPAACSLPALADTGPKPQITVVVSHPPAGEYYLDLLVTDSPSDSHGLYDNLRDKRRQYDTGKLSLLESYSESGWHPALAAGTALPLFGRLTGTPEGDAMVHTFSYVGVPDNFRLILVTPDHRLVTTPVLRRNTFQTVIHYDYQSGSLTQRGILLSYLLQFLTTLIPTLLIEGVILLLFRFSLRQSWKPFLLINLCTQLVMTLFLGSALLLRGLLAAYFLFIPVELGILLIETVYYTRALPQHSFRRRAAYAVTANAASAAAGWFLLQYEFLIPTLPL